ncbi:WD domain-containing protein [Didymella exigua CBS 183.55]|uniref:WD domain-containing protein n=1 Tax=Didymella exigua CBS 183.55 TaxID=1150837 RepID=A0A6A5S2M3_9PLEO|nr:WD domain-containing protein [Didymella exigua CBS 183.55]KAF1934362.1 WD domain-containing protein [Didymella exigua CBS 183.55]
MSPILHHECTRVPVTALASCGALLIAAEGSFLRFYHAKSSEFIASERIFKAQAVHGISVYAEELGNVTKVVVWGGRLVRALRFNALTGGSSHGLLSLCLSNVVKATDWILDLAPRMSSLEDGEVHDQDTCAAVTAHNALLELTIQYQNSTKSLDVNISELTASSRSILYSAHLLWESPSCILVAAGTAFGEIMYWSWSKSVQGGALSQIHQVFLGHEGSIFDVRISKELQRGDFGVLRRVIASCSDDRTIRLWDVSSVDTNADGLSGEFDTDTQRTRHTGFSVAAADEKPETSNCLAIGWGHTSRVWRIRFLDSSPCDGTLGLLSAGEDATSRTWKFAASIEKGNSPCTLQQTDCSAYHNGKNMWSIAAYHQDANSVRVACGAADGKLTTHPLSGANQGINDQGTSVAEYTLKDLLYMAEPSNASGDATKLAKASKKGDSIRSYCFISIKTFLLVTNTGKVLIESYRTSTDSSLGSNLSTSVLIDQLEDLSGYSTCTGLPTYKLAFLAGTKGSIYMYSAHNSSLRRIHTVTGKVGSLFVTDAQYPEGRKQIALLITLVGQTHSQLLFIDTPADSSQPSLKSMSISIPETLTGSTITSMSIVDAHPGPSTLLLGYRRGSIALYTIPHNIAGAETFLFRVIEKVHGDETVTAMMFRALPESASTGHLYSVGRDGCLAVHIVDTERNVVTLVHNLTLPIGPNIENIYIHQGHLLVHGFFSKKWVLYDITTEEEIMGIETGGAHRSWAFQSNSDSEYPGGTLVWTRTSSLHICSQVGANHSVVRSGGHGREIKAIAVSPPVPSNNGITSLRTLIATGAEDTDIKIFTYDAGELVCRRTLRKHTTGIQHLRWSDNGEYLFSSAGSEEFYIWRVQSLSTDIGIGIVCESVYRPESEFSDLRIMSFDVHLTGGTYAIAMAFSDSSVKTYRYTPSLAPAWQPLANGMYSTSCLTQTALLSPTLLFTAGTDGHAAFWFLPSSSSSVPSHENKTMVWKQPLLIHQNASKTISTHPTPLGTLIVSGGDDGALAFVLASPSPAAGEGGEEKQIYAAPRVIVTRAHGSAATACAILSSETERRVYVLTSGNDEWVRLWSVEINDASDYEDRVTIKRLARCKTSVADVSSMAVLGNDGRAARFVVCGVGMEVIRMEFGAGESHIMV